MNMSCVETHNTLVIKTFQETVDGKLEKKGREVVGEVKGNSPAILFQFLIDNDLFLETEIVDRNRKYVDKFSLEPWKQN